jgi:hypothetical protein
MHFLPGLLQGKDKNIVALFVICALVRHTTH